MPLTPLSSSLLYPLSRVRASRHTIYCKVMSRKVHPITSATRGININVSTPGEGRVGPSGRSHLSIIDGSKAAFGRPQRSNRSLSVGVKRRS